MRVCGVELTSWFWFRVDLRNAIEERLPRWIAWKLPRSVVMWCYFRVIADEPDPDAGLRVQRPIDVVDAWSRYHGLYGYVKGRED